MAITSPKGRVRATIRTHDPRSLGRGVLLFGAHTALYFATLLGAIANFALPVNTLFSVANGFFIALLFIIGHDANHGSFVPDPRWNRWLARIAFIPCVHAASLWRRTHNDMHHQRTNLKGVDHVWAPMSKAEYNAASSARRWLERVYRGPFGPLIYYYGTFWLYRMLVPVAPEVRAQWKQHVADSIFVLTGFVFTLAAIGLAGHALTPQRPLWLIYLVGWVLPFAVWNYLMGVTIYLNHTHPEIPWFGDEGVWSFHRGNVLSTVHVKMPRYVAPLYSDALAHTAHHADISMPVYELPAAQARLKSAYGKAVQEYTLSLAEYRKIYTACKLFDFERMCWTDFDGRTTATTWASGLNTAAVSTDRGPAGLNTLS